MPDDNQPPMPPAPPISADAPPSPTALEAPIGSILDPAASAPKLVVPPTPEQLAGFPPPPPIVAPPVVPSVETRPEMAPTPLPGSTPEMPAYQSGDRLRGLGMTLNPDTSGREELPAAAPPPPAQGKRFHELGQRTQAEIMAHWQVKNPGKPFPADEWVEPVDGSPTVSAGPVADLPENVVQANKETVKVSGKTLAEMKAGAAHLEAKAAERKALQDRMTEIRAKELAAEQPPTAGNMDYTEDR
jgi:hypothetical protein